MGLKGKKTCFLPGPLLHLARIPALQRARLCSRLKAAAHAAAACLLSTLRASTCQGAPSSPQLHHQLQRLLRSTMVCDALLPPRLSQDLKMSWTGLKFLDRLFQPLLSTDHGQLKSSSLQSSAAGAGRALSAATSQYHTQRRLQVWS